MAAEKTSQTAPKTTLEEGNLYFAYRPKVEHETVESIDDIQRFHMILEPAKQKRLRLITVGKKYLPKLGEDNQQGWCFVETISESAQELEAGLREEVYETKTRGERHLPAVRPVGEGVYKIVEYEGQTRLLYALELPQELGPAQAELNIAKTGNYIISVKNPEKSSPQGAGFQDEESKADFPERLQEKFGDRRFLPVNPTDFLNYAGAEVILISTDSDQAEDIGVKLHPENEDENTSEAINKLKMKKSRHPLEPLLEGELK